MKRTKFNDKKVKAILTSDWHLREDTPVCRTDDFQEAQWGKVHFISNLQQKYNCLVLHAGDLFDHWKPSPYLLSETMRYLPNQFYTIYGQHDLPQHNLELAYKNGINTLKEARRLTILPTCHWNETPTKASLIFAFDKLSILVWHVTTSNTKTPFESTPALSLLKKYDYDLILTGDNHQSFVVEYEGRLLVNPGSLTRQTADQWNHRPCVYLWYGDEVEQVFLPIEENVISREHLDRVEQHDKRIEAFIARLNEEWETTVSFEENLERFFKANHLRKDVIDIIYKAIEQ